MKQASYLSDMLTPVILCGGSGTRLWPLSRKSFPKQFVPLIGDRSLLTLTLERVGSLGPKLMCVAAEDHRFLITDAMDAAKLHGRVILEPHARNTAAAIALAALEVGNDGLLLVCPADHHIPDTAVFRRVIEQGMPVAQAGAFVTFGVVPTFPSTAYGYIEAGNALGEDKDVRAVLRFIEKPDADKATALLLAGNVLWNAGIFLARADVILAALRTHAPDILDQCTAAMADCTTDKKDGHHFIRPQAALFSACRAESIDYAVLEHNDNIAVVPFAGIWSDVGIRPERRARRRVFAEHLDRRNEDEAAHAGLLRLACQVQRCPRIDLPESGQGRGMCGIGMMHARRSVHDDVHAAERRLPISGAFEIEATRVLKSRWGFRTGTGIALIDRRCPASGPHAMSQVKEMRNQSPADKSACTGNQYLHNFLCMGSEAARTRSASGLNAMTRASLQQAPDFARAGRWRIPPFAGPAGKRAAQAILRTMARGTLTVSGRLSNSINTIARRSPSSIKYTASRPANAPLAMRTWSPALCKGAGLAASCRHRSARNRSSEMVAGSAPNATRRLTPFVDRMGAQPFPAGLSLKRTKR